MKKMLAEDTEKYVNYFKTPSQLFEALLTLVGSIIFKEYIVRESISSESQLQIALRYLILRNSMKFVSHICHQSFI